MLLNSSFLYAQTYQWGNSDKIGISKAQIDLYIEDYVNKNYPLAVKKYKEELLKLKFSKLDKYKNLIFINGDLMWQDNINNKELKLNALEATRYCRELKLATKKDWRLPSYEELLSLVDYYKMEPAILNEIKFAQAKRYWTISHDVKDISANWFVDFTNGQTGVALREIRYNLRCVRNLSNKEGEF